MSDLLEIKDLTYRKNLRVILDNVNLNIESGKIIALLGENGAGKTTLMRIITGIAKHYKGSVAVAGKEKEAERKSALSMTDSLKGFSDSVTIGWVRDFYNKIYSDFDKEQFEELLKFMKLNYDMKLGQISRGMREKLVIALTLSRKVKLYLLDEPFSGIDPMSRKRIINSILLWKDEDSTLIISDHFVNEISSILDEVIIVKDKTIASHISADEIREQGKSIEQYYEDFYQDEVSE
ncbi:ABC-2 type transport system ATP-binding protein [Lactobacillus colini]|uniref:ABC-2 type transport system ATP-binding protein n=1 Tax=Lactobacillus colini TaxID=1819254 RepID=A0ABS4MBN0_9LACO|nr:ABC transporter ATP-binding protein [Lactobacillus colini]MBP2057065.1 ABC-2 type transport system ATP-binding protein [Lactobacillus colini]